MTKPLSLLLTLFPCLLLASDYPTTSTAIVLPGLHEQGQDLQGSLMSEASVIDWEVTNNDLVFGSYKDRSDNERIDAVGYMYNQKLELNSGWIENEIRNYAEQNDINFEDYFLHFSEDTIIAEVDKSHGENTLLNRKPMVVGYTASEDHAGFWLYQQPPWDADVFEHSQQGGSLFIYHSEQFDRLTFKFSQFAQGGSFVIEYPTQIDNNGLVTQWKAFDIKNDKTQSMTKNQTIIWNVPSDWVRATTHDGSGLSYGGGQYFGSTFIRDGGRLYVTRVRWNGDNIEHRPRLKEIKLKNSFPSVKPADAPSTTADGKTIDRWRKIRGFDKSADLNQDNYLSPSEYKKRTNKNATARFRWESRIIPFGQMWNQNSSWAMTNLDNPDYLNAVQAFYSEHWPQHGLKGAYNDDTNKLIGPNQFHVYSGGTIDELNQIIATPVVQSRYQTHFSLFLKQLSQAEGNSLISVNIGTANLFGRNGQSHLIDAASLYLREHYLFPSTGFSGYAGLAKFWDNSALAHSGKKVIFQATTRYGRVEYFGNTQANWQNDQYSTLAIYYLNYHFTESYFNQWNSSYIYGSNNTTEGNFWKIGVAKNIAYQPSNLLSIDLGTPANRIPDGHQAIPLMLSTSSPVPADYTIIGNSSMDEVVHSDLPDGVTYLKPTYTYFIYKSANSVVNGGPEEMVLAREFSKGRVLYRTDFHGKNADYFSSPKLTISLEVPMRPVDSNGNIGEYTNEIEISGYEGLFLLY